MVHSVIGLFSFLCAKTNFIWSNILIIWKTVCIHRGIIYVSNISFNLANKNFNITLVCKQKMEINFSRKHSETTFPTLESFRFNVKFWCYIKKNSLIVVIQNTFCRIHHFSSASWNINLLSRNGKNKYLWKTETGIKHQFQYKSTIK